MKLLLEITALLPFLNVFSAIFLAKDSLKKSLNIIFSVLFLTILCVLYQKTNNDFYLEIRGFNQFLSFYVTINKVIISQLFLLNFIWLIFSFHAEKFLLVSSNKNINYFRIFFALAIAIINIIIIANNPLTLLLAQYLLTFSSYFLFHKILLRNKSILTQIFTVLLFGEIILFLLATVFTNKFLGNFSFDQNTSLNSLNSKQTLFLATLYLSAFFLTIITSSFLLYHKNIIIDLPLTYVVLPLFIGLAKIFLLLKIINNFFGIGVFYFIINKIGLFYFEIIFLLNNLVSLSWLLFARDFRMTFFYLFFSQISIAFLTIIIFSFFDQGNIYMVATNFILSITLVFLTFSNLILYLKNAKNKDFSGLFYDLKITISLMLFGFLSLIGMAPTLNLTEKYSLLKIALENNMFLTIFILALNLFCIFFFIIKLFFPFFIKSEIKKEEFDQKLSIKIDSASSLILSSSIVALIMFLLLIFSFFYDY